MYSENIQELIEAAQQMLKAYNPLTEPSWVLLDIARAYVRLEDAIKVLQAQEQELPPLPEEVQL